LTLLSEDIGDLLTLGDQVAFSDDTTFGGVGTKVRVRGNGTVVYNGTTDYQGAVTINNANFEVNGLINQASISVCRDIRISSQRGKLSGIGTLTGDVFVNSGTISPSSLGVLTLGSLALSSADLTHDTVGSLVHIEINSEGSSLVAVTRSASLAGTLEIDLDPNAPPGTYTILTSSGITGLFDNIIFTGQIPNYTISYLPIESPTYVQFDFLGYPVSDVVHPPSHLQGKQKKNDFGLEYELYNELTWKRSSSSKIVGYFIYRDGKKIAKGDKGSYIYKDHHRKKGETYLYAIRAFNSEGDESSAAEIVIKP
ncbi:MAG: hypothetical protein JSS09_00260, partial [Verrucomicrobia bacterium]|nr:hypothetical protein [Verrucomicrobiota bacterium]